MLRNELIQKEMVECSLTSKNWEQSIKIKIIVNTAFILCYNSSCLNCMCVFSTLNVSNTLEPRYNTVRYNTNSDITWMRVGPQFLPSLLFSYLLNRSMFSKRVNTVIKTVR